MKDKINKYRKLFYKGEWHIHTNYTDGKNSVDEYCQAAIELNIPLLAFTEHVRKNLTYDFNSLLNEIQTAKEKYPKLIILSGCEAKVLPDGILDCSDDILKKCEYVLFAYHSFPDDINLYLSSIKKILENSYIDCWAHPGLYFNKHHELKLAKSQLLEIFTMLNERNILFEINFKYNLPPKEWVDLYTINNNQESIILGGDIHSILQLKKTVQLKKDFIQNWKMNKLQQNSRNSSL